jgi:hypothetical protein
MHMHSIASRSSVRLLALLLPLAGACRDQADTPMAAVPTETTALLQSANPATSAIQDERFRSSEARSAALSREVPGFGGFYFDEGGNLHVYVRDMVNEGLARAAVAQDLAESRREARGAAAAGRAANPQIIVHAAKFEFAQLADWRNRLTEPVLQVPGVVYNGLNEPDNVLEVGIDRKRGESVRAHVMRTAASLGIPDDAILVALTDPICPVQSESCDPCTFDPASCETDPCTVDPSSCPAPDPEPCTTDCPAEPTDPSYGITPGDPSYSIVRPGNTGTYSLGSKFPGLGGAMRIRNYGKPSACTLGFAAIYKGVAAIATNSHCTPTEEYNDNSPFYQPSWSYAEVAREYVDLYRRTWSRRIADLALARAASGTNVYLGYVAHPRGRYAVKGDTLVSTTEPWFRIIGEGAPRYNYVFEKVGAATGWTAGYAKKVCYDTSIYSCATWVQAGTDHGDSGAPVLRWYGANQGVLLVGMVYAKADGGFWMNPMSQIRTYLNATGAQAGDLRTY